VDLCLRVVVVLGLIAWASGVAYSRWGLFTPSPAMTREINRPYRFAVSRFKVRSGLSCLLRRCCGVLGLGSLLRPRSTP